MKRLPLLLVTILLSSCTSAALKKWEGRTVFNKVGIKTEGRRNAYRSFSTNHIGLGIHLPVNSKFHVVGISRKKILLSSPKLRGQLQLVFAKKHSHRSFADYLDRMFSSKPVPLSSKFSAKERKLIQEGRFEVGMSRKALFKSIGYPPDSLNGNLKASVLTYEKKRFNRTSFTFNNKDRLVSIKD